MKKVLPSGLIIYSFGVNQIFARPSIDSDFENYYEVLGTANKNLKIKQGDFTKNILSIIEDLKSENYEGIFFGFDKKKKNASQGTIQILEYFKDKLGLEKRVGEEKDYYIVKVK